MTFTFGEDLSVARDYVRFHTGDTQSPGYMSDELITSLLAVSSSNNEAVIAGLRYIIQQLARPDFKADWLMVTNDEARKGYQAMLNEKRREFGIAAVTAETQHVWRADSLADEAPDYD